MNDRRLPTGWIGLIVGAALGAVSPPAARAQAGAIVADRPSANPDGPTIFKGQTYYPYGSNEDYGGFGAGLPIFRFGRTGSRLGAVAGGHPVAGVASAPAATRPIPAPAGPYLTNQTYEPGDGWRYPLYYNPATATYFYHPVAR